MELYNQGTITSLATSTKIQETMIEDRPEDNRQEEDPEPTTKDKILKTTLIDYKIIKEPQD